MRGGTTHVLSRWRASDALRMIAEHRMTSIGGIPTQVALMLQEPDFDSYDLSSVRAIVMGGGPATPALVREARERFGAAVAIRYSCTEAGIGIGTAFDAPLEDAEVSVGRPHAGVELDLRDDRRRRVGEVCLRSAAVMDGYWRAPELTAEAFTDGRFRAHRRPRLDRRRRPAATRRPGEGDVRARRLQRLSHGGRSGARHPSGHRRRRGGAPARRRHG